MDSSSVRKQVEVIPQKNPSQHIIDQYLEGARVLTIITEIVCGCLGITLLMNATLKALALIPHDGSQGIAFNRFLHFGRANFIPHPRHPDWQVILLIPRARLPASYRTVSPLLKQNMRWQMKGMYLYGCAFASLLICSPSAHADYKPKSAFSGNYKCVSSEDGGFNHTENGHQLVHFKDQSEFFITHISRIPAKVLPDLAMAVEGNEDELRQKVEKKWLKQNKYSKDLIVEDGAFFIRSPEQDPLSPTSYIFSRCSAYKTPSEDSISCYVEDSRKNFYFNLKTKRFSYSYLGTWDNTIKDKYYGDSSVFAFGVCKEYYD